MACTKLVIRFQDCAKEWFELNSNGFFVNVNLKKVVFCQVVLNNFK